MNPCARELIADFSLLRPETVLERRGCKKSQLYADIRQGVMTPGLKKGSKFTVWPAFEVDALNRAEIAGASVEERRALVRQLVTQRAALMPALGAVPEGGHSHAA